LHPRDVLSVGEEIAALKDVSDCNHVIHLKDVYEDPDHTFLVMEHVPGDLLLDRLIKNKKFTEFDAKEFVRKLLLGVAHCHRKRIAIRNLKLENLLLVSSLGSDNNKKSQN
jgi:serine/threonine protein kinase